jgi:hypothetical protein
MTVKLHVGQVYLQHGVCHEIARQVVNVAVRFEEIGEEVFRRYVKHVLLACWKIWPDLVYEVQPEKPMALQ